METESSNRCKAVINRCKQPQTTIGKLGNKIISSICLNCGGSDREKCWNCDGAGGKWKEVEGQFEWEKCSSCWGDGGYNCINCSGTGVSD